MAKDTLPFNEKDAPKPPVVTRTAAVGQAEVPAGLPPEAYMTAQETHVAEGGEYAPPPETEVEAAARLKATPPKPAPDDDDDEDDEDGDETVSKGKGKKGKK